MSGALSSLPAASAVSTADTIPLTQYGTPNVDRKATVAQVLAAGSIAAPIATAVSAGIVEVPTSGNLAVDVNGNISIAKTTSLASYQATPSNPTGTTSTSAKMMGLAGAITPAYTGKVLISIVGSVQNQTGVGDGATIQIAYGTGTAPTNGATATGTVAGPLIGYVSSTTNAIVPFALTAIVTGMSTGVAHWVDLQVAAVVAGTAAATDIGITLVEML